MDSRLSITHGFLQEDGLIEVAIDEEEAQYLSVMMSQIYGRDSLICNFSVMHNPKGRDADFVAMAHEYMLVYAKNKNECLTFDFKLDEGQMGKKFAKDDGNGAYRELPLKRTGTGKLRIDRPYMFFPFYFLENENLLVLPNKNEFELIYNGHIFDDSYLESLNKKYENKGFVTILPRDRNGEYLRWRWGFTSCTNGVRDGAIIAKSGNLNTVFELDKATDNVKPKSLWYGEKYDASSKGTNLLASILPSNPFDYPKSLYLVMDAIVFAASNKDIVMDYFGGSGTTAHAVINLNRQDNGQRKYILMEQGEYFDTVLKPRIQKVVFSENWKEGKAQANNIGSFNGISHAFKVLKIESYEDTLNNLELTRSKGQTDFINQMQPQERSQYLMHYMLKLESKGSLLSVTDFLKPFGYQLNITTDSAGAYQTRTVDLVETFNYLLGLRVKQIDMQLDKGFVQVIGTLPNGESALIFWRDCDKINYEQLNKLLDKLHINPRDAEYDVIYVNGDHNIPTVFQSTIDEGGITRTQKIRQIEREFLDRMFAGA